MSARAPLSPAEVARAGLKLAQPCAHRDATWWLEGRPTEGGRVALMRHDARGLAELLPGRSVRSRVYEYGGGAYAVGDPGVVFVDDADQQVWFLPHDGAPRRLSGATGCRHGDLAFDARHARVLAIREDGRADAHRPRHELVALPLEGGAPRVLATGAAFYAAPRAHGDALCWLEWDEADMPWDATRLMLAGVAGDGALRTPRCVAGGAGESVCQPEWAADGALWFASDASGRWQLERFADGARRRVTEGRREHALPAWQLGQRCYGLVDATRVVAAGAERGLWRAALLDGARRELAPALTQFEHLHAAHGRAVALAGGPRQALAVVELDLERGGYATLRSSTALEIDAPAEPEPVEFATEGGTAWALVYAPRARGAPPLVVRCHGGPTAAASSALEPRVQAWVQRGYGFCDVNYRGSTGFGRAYRAALDGAWGVADVADCLAAARHCAATERGDPGRLAVLGASAGGFTALGALAAGEPFRCGSVQYPVADLVTAMHDTHKFEARYGDRLLGPWPAARATWEARSPLNRVAAIRAPVAFFQGEADPVVPRDQTARMAAALAAAGVACEAHYFPGEGHGFRRAETLERVLALELEFVGRALGN